MNRRWIAMALLLAIFPLLAIEMKSEASAHADHIHKTQEQTAFAQRSAEITTVEFGGALGFAYSPQHTLHPARRYHPLAGRFCRAPAR